MADHDDVVAYPVSDEITGVDTEVAITVCVTTNPGVDGAVGIYAYVEAGLVVASAAFANNRLGVVRDRVGYPEFEGKVVCSNVANGPAAIDVAGGSIEFETLSNFYRHK